MIQTKPLSSSNKLPWAVERVAGNGEAAGPGALTSYYRENEDELLHRLLQYGAVLFRGFGIDSPPAFAEFTRSVWPELMEAMEENVPRTRLTSGVYTSTEYPAEYMLSMHSEYSFAHAWPAKLFFCCITPAREGGATPIIDNREVLKLLNPDIVESFSSKKIKYIRNLHEGRGFGLSWQTAFQTNDRAVVESYCRQTKVEFEWKPDGGLRLIQIRDGVISHPETGENVWFNQAPQFHASDYPKEIYEGILSAHKGKQEDMPQTVCFDDDTPMEAASLNHIRETMQKHAVAFPWQKGDVLLVDNVLVSHGRMPFVGPRKILFAMSKS